MKTTLDSMTSISLFQVNLVAQCKTLIIIGKSQTRQKVRTFKCGKSESQKKIKNCVKQVMESGRIIFAIDTKLLLTFVSLSLKNQIIMTSMKQIDGE